MVDTTITPPARLEPPFRSPLVNAEGVVTVHWHAWFSALTDRLEALEARVTALEPP